MRSGSRGLRKPPVAGALVERAAVHVGLDLERGQRSVGDRALGVPDPLRDQRAVGIDVGADVGERAPVAGQAEARVEVVNRCRASSGTRPPDRACSRSRNRARPGRAGGRRRSAAGPRADADRREKARAPGVGDMPRPDVGLDLDARQQVAIGRDRRRRRTPGPCELSRRGRAASVPGRRTGARPRASPRAGLGVTRGPGMCSWSGCIHSSQPARRRSVPLAVVVGMRMGADDEPYQSRPSPTCEGASSSTSEPGSWIPVSKRTMPSPWATAHAFRAVPRATAAAGAGARSPGSTRSPRPSSGLRASGRHSRSAAAMRRRAHAGRPPPIASPADGEDQGQEPDRRARRRRDDPDHLGLHQGAADPALPRRRAEVLRPRDREPRRDRRPDHRRRRERDQGVRGRRQVRDDHPRRGPRRGVRAEARCTARRTGRSATSSAA